MELITAMTEIAMDHKRLLAGLSDAERVRLTAKSNVAGLTRLASHLVAIVATSVWILSGAPGWQIALLGQGILIIFLFTLLHETVHYTPFRTAWMNSVAGIVCGFVVLIPPIWFRYFHLAHHRHTHDVEHDPELQTAKPATLPSYIWHVSGIPTWYSQVATLIRNAAGRMEYSYLPRNARLRVSLEAWLFLAGYAGLGLISTAAGSSALVWLWLLPVVLGQPFLRLYLMAEHDRCPHVSNMLENTRTTYTTRFVRWLAWNMPYHVEHHAYPNVPFHRLPEFHRLTRDFIKVQKNGYTGFHGEKLAELTNHPT